MRGLRPALPLGPGKGADISDTCQSRSGMRRAFLKLDPLWETVWVRRGLLE